MTKYRRNRCIDDKVDFISTYFCDGFYVANSDVDDGGGIAFGLPSGNYHIYVES